MTDVVDGQTPIDENESGGLRLRVRTQGALNRAEEENILRARLWASRSRIVRRNLLVDASLRRIHKEMFGAVWEWAGKYRLSDKNIGIPWSQIPMAVRQLCDNFAARTAGQVRDRDLLAVEFHFDLVTIHAFPNGNGRHARFCADRLIENMGGQAFEWGGADLQATGRSREQYIRALRAADRGDLKPLLAFSRASG